MADQMLHRTHAEFLFEPVGEIEAVVKETKAIPFNAPGAIGHMEGK